MPELAIIGGTGFAELPALDISDTKNISTAYGQVTVQTGHLFGREVVFLPRHGKPANLPPHKVNYLGNIQALADLGIQQVIGLAAVGSVDPKLGVGSIVVPDQIIDYTWGRPQTFYEDIHHIDFSYPYDESLRQDLIQAFQQLSFEFHGIGTYGATQGPRLETAAEIRRMGQDGCTIVGMTGMPEAALVREKDMAYACLAMVVNKGAGLTETVISLEEIHQVMDSCCERVLLGLERYLQA